MRVLFFVDTHGNENYHKRLIEIARGVDVVVCAGDITLYGNKLNPILESFSRMGKPLLILHGNPPHENATDLIEASAKHKNIYFFHKQHHQIDDVVFFGYGGGGFSLVDNHFDIVMNNLMQEFEGLKKKHAKELKLVLVTHAPPFGTLLDDLGEHVGCQNITKFILENKPVLAISGHIHESAGKEQKINKTLLINPGPQGRIIVI